MGDALKSIILGAVALTITYIVVMALVRIDGLRVFVGYVLILAILIGICYSVGRWILNGFSWDKYGGYYDSDDW